MLHRSTDGGATWEECSSIRQIPGYESWTFPPEPHIPHIRSIATDPTEPGVVYIGAEEGVLYRSADGGQTWEGLNEGLNWDLHVVLPTKQRSRMYATTGCGLHRSDDDADHWIQVEGGLPARACRDPFHGACVALVI